MADYSAATTASGINAPMQTDADMLNVLQNKENGSNAGGAGIARKVAGYQIVPNGTGGDAVKGANQVMLVYYQNPDGSISPSFTEESFDKINEGRNDNPAQAPSGGYMSDADYNKAWDSFYGGGSTSGGAGATQGGGGYGSPAGGGYQPPSYGSSVNPNDPAYYSPQGGYGAPTAPGGGSGSTGYNGQALNLGSLTGDQRNAYTAVQSLFDSYGLGSLAPKIYQFVQNGYDQATTSLLLQQSPEYQERFSGNSVRSKNGLPVLSPAEYLATERAYKDAASAYGLPRGFYDDPSDFANLIGNDISPTEFQSRASDAFKYAQSGNPEARMMLNQYYGVDDSHIAAYFLDPARAQAVIDRASAAVDIGAAGARQGVGVNRAMAEGFADQGVSAAQAQHGFGQVSDAYAEGQGNIAQRFGSDLSTTDVANEFVGGLASAARKRNLLNEQEQALFANNAGSARGSFSQDSMGGY